MRKVERLLNLIALLLDTRRPLTADQIRAAIYPDQSVGAFKRMFERDKEELRDLDIPVERAPTDVWEIDEGYRIRREEATLPHLDLTPDEHAALWLAARAWQGQDSSAQRALLKLSLTRGGAEQEPDPGWLALRVEASSPHLAILLDSIGERRRVRFRYRAAGADAAAERAVEPHALTYRGGWYLAGFDAERGAVRHFKLARIEGTVHADPGRVPQFQPASAAPPIPRGPWEGASRTAARIAFGPKSAWWVERRTGARRVAERPDGWVELSLPVADRETFVSWLLGFADDAEVLAPRALRDAVVRRLRRSAGEPPRARKSARKS